MDGETQSRPAEEEARARLALARRFLAAQSDEAEIELKPGEMAIDLPIPPGALVAGSLMRSGRPAGMILDSPQTPEEAFAFYDAHLPALGWAVDTFMRRGGFVTSSPSLVPSRYISDEQGRMLLLAIRERPEGGVAVFITIMAAPDRAQWARQAYGPVLQRAMPPLMAPRGASLTEEGGGGSDTAWRSYARMTTTLDPGAVMAHFDSQLATGGWRRVDGGATDSAGWSLWSVTVESRSLIGALTALRIPERQDEYLLEARLEASERPQPGGGGFSYAPMVSRGGPGQPR